MACKGMATSRVSKGSAEFLYTEQWRVIRLRSHAIGKPTRAGASASVNEEGSNLRVILHVPYCVTGFIQKNATIFQGLFKGHLLGI